MLSFSIPAFAAEETGVPEGSYNAEVTGTYVAGTTGGTVFSVDISWSGMSFTYHAEQEPVWDAENHTYSDAKAAYWEGTGTITVTNHSNAAVTANVAYTPVTNTGVTGTLNTTEKTLAAGAEGKPDEADALVATLTISGKPNENVTNAGVKIGSITVTLS